MKTFIKPEQYRRFIRSIWLFPAVLTAILLLLTALGINGSSIGTYNTLFYGEDKKDQNLLLGDPRDARTDEWLVNTQLTIAQAKADYPRINDNVGNGQDMSLGVDAPYKEWSALFKPHNLAFFVLPFDNAFAFKWWFMGYLLMLSCYFFMITLLPKKRLWATLISLTLFFNPFVQWWYLSGTMAPLYYSLFAATAVIMLFDAKSRRQALLWGALLAYLMTCFALILYPPFQIPCAIVMGGFASGYLCKRFRDLPRKAFFNKLGVVGLSVLVAGAAAFTFVQTRHDIINTMKGTVYPGRRIAFSGMNDALQKTFSAPLSFGLQNERKGASYLTNYNTSQSEAATFIKLNLIFVPIILLVLYKNARLRKTLPYYLFLATTAALTLLATRIFTPFFDRAFQFLLLHQVPNERLEIALLLLCIMQIGLLGSLLLSAKKELLSKKEALFAAVVGLILFGDTSMSMAEKFPLFITSHYLIIMIVAGIALSIYLLLRKKTYVWGLALFLAINVVSSIGVNPLYAKPQPDVLKFITQHIDTEYPDDGKKWAVFDQLVTENIPQMAGKPALTGVYSHPQLELWQRLDEKGEDEEYNRYAHTAFTVNKAADGGRFTNPGPDIVLVNFDCTMAQKLPNFGYALSSLPITDPSLDCLVENEKLEHPNLTLYIYKYVPKS
ncbi:MAG: hypothetical protein AAB834_05915 [Patescibacteria group bacterium]